MTPLRSAVATICTLVLAAGCGTSGTPAVTPAHDDGGQDAKACETLRDQVEGLYSAAAEEEGVAMNLRNDFIGANLHMVMSDCSAKPRQVATCVRKASSVRDIETQCLLPLDDAGKVEGRRFASGD